MLVKVRLRLIIAPQGLEIGEKLLWLFEEPHDVTKPGFLYYFGMLHKTLKRSYHYVFIPNMK